VDAARFPPLRGGQVAGADGLDLAGEGLGVIGLGIEPVAVAVRLECCGFLKINDPPKS
jgi:hypothetical protein